MKLFNWIQRRPHRTVLKDEAAKNEELNITNGLADGILTIGTLGLDLDPLNFFTQHNDYFVLEEEEESDVDSNDEQLERYDSFSVDSDDVEEEEENPLVFTRFQNMYEEMERNSSGFDAPAKEKGERVTLAELFMADSEVKKEVDYVEVIETNKVGKKPAKNGFSLAKKLIPHFKEDSRPINKIHKMVKRMLKRKIHPEVEEGKGDGGKITRGNEIADSASVLPTQLALATGPNT